MANGQYFFLYARRRTAEPLWLQALHPGSRGLPERWRATDPDFVAVGSMMPRAVLRYVTELSHDGVDGLRLAGRAAPGRRATTTSARRWSAT